MGGEAEARGQVHPGADDNASGTAMVVELARELKARPNRRSILLLHFGGEEEGLLGSQYWVQHPTHPLESVKFMLNFDMVGRLDLKAPKLMMGGLGAPKSAVEAAQKFVPKDFSVSADVGASVGGSDHMSFSQAKIPTFFFFTGIHGEYHRPTDTTDRINFPGMVKLVAFGKAVTLDLANADTLPAFDPETAKLPSRGDGGPMRIAFGTIPDYADNPKGFRINGVSKGGTAETIGLQAGDILTHFGDKPVKNVYDFMGALGAFKAGDKVVIQWLRGDQPMQAEATLKGRRTHHEAVDLPEGFPTEVFRPRRPAPELLPAGPLDPGGRRSGPRRAWEAAGMPEPAGPCLGGGAGGGEEAAHGDPLAGALGPDPPPPGCHRGGPGWRRAVGSDRPGGLALPARHRLAGVAHHPAGHGRCRPGWQDRR